MRLVVIITPTKKSMVRRGAQAGAAAAVMLGVALSGPVIGLATADSAEPTATGAAAPRQQTSRPARPAASRAAARKSAPGTLTPAGALPVLTSGASATAGAEPNGPLGDVLQAGAVQLLGLRQARRQSATATGPAVAAAAVSNAPRAAALPITTVATNSFTTIFGTTAAGSVSVNGHTWTADPTTHLYTTATDLANEWQTYYTQMKAGQGSSLNDIQRLEGNAEAVFENTGLKNLTAEQLSIGRQDAQRQFDAMYAAFVGAGVNLDNTLTSAQYLAVETVLQGDPTLLELGLQGHGLNNSSIARYAGYTTDFQNRVDGQTLYVGGGLNNGKRAIANFFDDNILTHMPFPTTVNNGVLWQTNQNGNREDKVVDSVAALNASLTRTYVTADFLQPPQLVTKTPRQTFTNGTAFTFTLPANTFVDLQGQAITYTATLAGGAALPSWVTFNPQTGQFAGTPPAGTGNAVVVVTATNTSGLHTSEAFGVVFREPAPVLTNRTPTQNQRVNTAFTFTLAANTFVDPLGQTMTYTANLPGGATLPNWLTFNAQTGQFSGTAPVGTKSVTVVLTATNSSGVKAAESFAIKFA